jgi:hypothetical protein
MYQPLAQPRIPDCRLPGTTLTKPSRPLRSCTGARNSTKIVSVMELNTPYAVLIMHNNTSLNGVSPIEPLTHTPRASV